MTAAEILDGWTGCDRFAVRRLRTQWAKRYATFNAKNNPLKYPRKRLITAFSGHFAIALKPAGIAAQKCCK